MIAPTLYVGDTIVPTAADGTFTATIRARGHVFVHVTDVAGSVGESVPEPYALVRLDGRGDYSVPDFQLGRCDAGRRHPLRGLHV